MEYYVINTVILKDDTKAQNIFAYDDKKEALSAYHSTLASNYVSDKVKSFFDAVTDSNGTIIAREVWNETIPMV